MSMARDRQKKLGETVQAYVLVREAAELANWIKDKEQFAQVEDVGEDLEQVSNQSQSPSQLINQWDSVFQKVAQSLVDSTLDQ